MRRSPVILIVLASAGLTLLAGCQPGTTAEFPVDSDTLWRMAVSETIIWHPDSIDPDAHEVTARYWDPITGRTVQYRMTVEPYGLYFNALNPGVSRATILIEQTVPERLRYRTEEQALLLRVRARLGQ